MRLSALVVAVALLGSAHASENRYPAVPPAPPAPAAPPTPYLVTNTVIETGVTRELRERRALNAQAQLSVRNVAGVIEVEGWDKSEMELTGVLGESADKLDISGNADALKIEVKLRKGNRHYSDGETLLKLRVPQGVALTLDGTSADLVASGIKGPVVARTVSGDVRLAVTAKQVTAQTVSGDLELAVPAAKEVKLNTVSGDVRVEGASGVLLAESVSGDVQIEGGVFSQLDLKSVSGDVAVEAGYTPDAKVKAESLSGDVRLNAPASLSAKVTMKTFSGDKHCFFDGATEAGDGKRLVKTIGAGQGQFTLTSFSGDVMLDKQ